MLYILVPIWCFLVFQSSICNAAFLVSYIACWVLQSLIICPWHQYSRVCSLQLLSKLFSLLLVCWKLAVLFLASKIVILHLSLQYPFKHLLPGLYLPMDGVCKSPYVIPHTRFKQVTLASKIRPGFDHYSFFQSGDTFPSCITKDSLFAVISIASF